MLNEPTLARGGYLRSVAGHLTWRAILLGQVLSITLGLYKGLGVYIHFAPGSVPAFVLIHMGLSGILINEIGINSALLATVCAYEAVRRGANGWWAYPVALVLAAAFTGFAQWPARDLLHMRIAMDDFDPEHPFRRYGHMLVIGGDFLLTGICIVLVYTNRAREVECILLARAAQLRRARIERELAQSELITVQTRLDPEQIHRDLQQLRDLYARRAPEAETELDALVQSLRQRTRSATLMVDAPEAGA